MGMRVIAGTYRHRLLSYPEDDKDIRPTKDRIREAFFSSLGDISGLTFLDLYAGSGSMGIEAISRGALKSTFVDKNDKALNYVKENVNALKIDNAEILKLEDVQALYLFHDQKREFDIIYIDPPYDYNGYEEVIAYIFENELLSENGVLAFEHNKKINTNPLWYRKIKEYHYGEIFVTVLRK